MQLLNEKNFPADSLHLLAVDDETFNLEILSEWLMEWGAKVDTAANGKQALEQMAASTHSYDAILLDRMMPEMDGFEFLSALCRHSQWKNIAVIMQSAAATMDEIQYAISAGIRYYLSKPFDRAKLYSVVEAAVAESWLHAQLRELVKRSQPVSGSQFEIQTLQQAQDLSPGLAGLSADPEKVVIGLYELLVNAVEHGNLEIGYKEKTRLLNDECWLQEIESRLQRTPYSSRVATVSVSIAGGNVCYLIKDQGVGFNSKEYLQLNTRRAADNHGRGVAYANNFSFDQLHYRGRGKEVLAITAAGKQMEM